MPRVLFVLASRDFRDEEYLEPRRAFDAAGFEVTVASGTVGPIRGALGTWVRSERLVSQVRASDFDAIVFAGGDGARELLDSRAAHRLCRDAVSHGRVLAAICLAPAILARAGVLRDIAATCHPDARPDLAAGGAVVRGEPLAVSGHIVTADCPASAAQFAAAVVGLVDPRRK